MEKSKKFPGVFRLPDGRWKVKTAVRVGTRTVFKERALPAGATEEDAGKLAIEFRQAMVDGAGQPPTPPTPPPVSVATVRTYGKAWLALRGKRMKPAGIETYIACMYDHILPVIGELLCRDVTRRHVEEWVVAAEAKLKPNGDPYAHDSMRQWWRVLRTVLRDMAADHDIPDPTSRVRPPERPELPQIREQRTLDAKQIGDLIAHAQTFCPDRAAEVAVMALTGMRAGECYALKWECVEFKHNTITVKRSLSRGKLTETTKTKAQRLVPMHPDLALILLDHQHAQDQRVAKDPKLKSPLGLVFTSETGGIREPSSANKVWVLLRDALGTDIKVGPQVLRRSLNTQLVLAGVDRITTRAIMGHTSEEMTARYSGVSQAAKANAVKLLRAPTTAQAPTAEA